MGPEGITAKKILLGIIFLIWFLPLIQQIHPFVELRKLDGAVTYSPDDSLTLQKWFDRSYADHKENYLNEQFGFRNFFVRGRNQIYFSLLKVPTAKGVVIGKDNVLYEEKYINSYTGRDFIGEGAMREKMRKLKFVTDTLKKLNIDLVLLMAPGKATYFPEYIPDSYYKNADTVNTNYKYAVRIAKEMGINFLDYNAIFKSLKPTTKFPLFPKTGIHWSLYSAHYAFDTLISYIENLKHKQLPHFKYNKVEWSYDMRDPDEDIGLGLNTLFKIKPFKMPYPTVEYTDTVNKYRPKVTTISDSFWLSIYFASLPKNVFTNPQFWYFYKQIMDYSPNVGDPVTLDLKKEIEKNDIILLMSTEAHMNDFGWGFVEDAYDLYSKGENSLWDRERNLSILRMVRWMQTEPKTMFETKLKADKMNIPLDSMLRLEAFRLLGYSNGTLTPQQTSALNIQHQITDVLKKSPALLKENTSDKRIVPGNIKLSAINIFNTAKKFSLMASNNKYVCDDEGRDNLLIANREKAGFWETFSLIRFGNNKCAIYSHLNLFVSAELMTETELTAKRSNIGDWEIFTISYLDDGSIALKASNGKYLSLDESSSRILAKSETIGPKEKFKIVFN